MRSKPLCLVLLSWAASAEPQVGAGVGNADTFIAEGTKQYRDGQNTGA